MKTQFPSLSRRSVLTGIAAASLGVAALTGACASNDGPPEPPLEPPTAPERPPAAGPPPATPAPPPPAAPGASADPDYFEHLPKHEAQLKILCDRKGQDTVSKAFCAKPGGPKLTGLADVLAAVGLSFKDRTKGNGTGGNPGFAITGHSSSLVMRTVTAANPRAIVFTPPPAVGASAAYVAMGFTRGEQLIEFATRDPETGEPAFYLLKYEQPCNATKSCGAKDLVGPATESGWTNWTLYEDEDLGNTPMDCLRCHQPNAKQKPFLRMQERTDPFTHWFSASRDGGRALLADYHGVHGHGEDYGPIPAALVDASDPALLARFVDQNNAGLAQPNAFDSAAIEREVRSSSALQPTVNDPPGKSATWQKLFDGALGGAAIRPPYHDVKVASAPAVEAFGQGYRAMLTGTASAPLDVRALFVDGAKVDLGLRPKPGASGADILKQMCGECHNSRLDPAVSRARFDATRLDQMSPGEKSVAAARLGLPAGDRLRMPPAVFGELSTEEITRAQEALR
jgi:hypothetical protein